MTLRHLFLALACLAVLAGCGSGNSTTAAGGGGTKATEPAPARIASNIVGTWTSPTPAGGTSTFEFKGDGSFSNETTASDPQTKATSKMTTIGTYKLEGEKFTMKIADMKFDSSDAKQNALFKQQAGEMAKAIQALPEMTGTLKFMPGNQAELHMNATEGMPADAKPAPVTLTKKE